VLGVHDSTLQIDGLFCSTKEIDSFINNIDSIIHDGRIVSEVTKKPPSASQIVCDCVTTKNKKVVVITITTTPDHKEYTMNGIKFHRLNASNYEETGRVYYSQKELDSYLDAQKATYASLLEKVNAEVLRQEEKKKALGNAILSDYISKIAILENELKKKDKELAGLYDDLEVTTALAEKACSDLEKAYSNIQEHTSFQKTMREKKTHSQGWGEWLSQLSCI